MRRAQVLEVVYYAQKAVLHPVAPLYDVVRTHPCTHPAAARRLSGSRRS